MTTFKAVFVALVLFLLSGMSAANHSEQQVAQSADVPTFVRGG